MKAETKSIEAWIGRRGLLKVLGAAGLGAAFWPRGARAGWNPGEPETVAALSTAISDWDGLKAVLSTGPLTSISAPAGSRLGVCLIAGSGVQGAGPAPVIQRIERARVGVVGTCEADRGVERSVYRLLGGLDTVRPVELFGLSAEVPEALRAGQTMEIIWEATLRGAADSTAALKRYLDHYHACVVGRLARDATFTGRLSFYEISRRFAEEPKELKER